MFELLFLFHFQYNLLTKEMPMANLIKEEFRVSQEWNEVNMMGWYKHWNFRHKGVDFATYGKIVPCYSLFDGEIVFSGWNGNWGKQVVVYNDVLDRYFVYAHLFTISVPKGQMIRAGTKVGEVGNTGWSTGIHLHYGVYSKGLLGKKNWEDPWPYLNEEILPLTDEEMRQLDELEKRLDSIENNLNFTMVRQVEDTGEILVHPDFKDSDIDDLMMSIIARHSQQPLLRKVDADHLKGEGWFKP